MGLWIKLYQGRKPIPASGAQAARVVLLAEDDYAELHRALTNLDVLGAVGGADELAVRAQAELRAFPPSALLRAERMRLAWCAPLRAWAPIVCSGLAC